MGTMARTVRPRVTTPRRTTTNPRQGHRTPTRTRPNEINHSKHGSDLGHPGAEINHNKPSKINHNKPNEINRNKPDEISRNKLDGTGHGANTGDVYMTEVPVSGCCSRLAVLVATKSSSGRSRASPPQL